MAIPSFGLLSIIIFLLPGLGGIKVGLKVAERGDWLSRLETTTLSFALSLSSILLLYIVSTIYLFLSHGELLTQTTLASWLSTLPLIIIFYILLVIICLCGGYVIGCFDFGANHFSSTLPWTQFHEMAENNTKNETYFIRVRTLAGDELRGTVENEGEAALNKDIILEDPQRLRFDQEGGIAEDKSWTGDAYIHSQSIAHVEFDRLEDADAAEATDYNRQKQKTLQDTFGSEDDKEIEELEELSEEFNENEEKDS